MLLIYGLLFLDHKINYLFKKILLGIVQVQGLYNPR